MFPKKIKSVHLVLAVFSLSVFLITPKTGAGDMALTEQDKQQLIMIARETLETYLKDGKIPKIKENDLSKAIMENGACFVTLNKKGSGLRGCIGIFERERPLYKNVISRTIAAATQDPRFPIVTQDELKDIKIEISVLTEPKPLQFKSSQDLLAKLRPLTDGVILHTRYGGSTFLPQVWEQLPDKEAFLSRLCQKHGAPGNAWKRDIENIAVETYQAIVFGEDVYGGHSIPKTTKSHP